MENESMLKRKSYHHKHNSNVLEYGLNQRDIVDEEELKPMYNPFLYDPKMTKYERVKIACMVLTLVPLLRLLLLLVLFLLLVILACIGTLGHDPLDKNGKDVPLSKYRKIILYPMRWIARIALFVIGFYWIPVKYPKGGHQKAFIVVSNHVTFIDGIFFLAHRFPSVALRSDLGDIPVLGRIIRAVDPILINRRTAEGRKRALQQIHDRPAMNMNAKDGNVFSDLLIFPEGTTSCNSNLTKFKRGPFAPGLPVQPVVLQYPHKHFDISWTPSISPSTCLVGKVFRPFLFHATLVYLVGRMLCQFKMNLSVEYLPVHSPTLEERNNAELFAENVRQEMASVMNVPVTNHAFEDVMLLVQMGDYAGQILQQTTVEQARKVTMLNVAEVEALVGHFAANDVNQDGEITYDEMKDILQQPDSTFLRHLFSLLDRDGDEVIDFQELCLGLSILSPNFTSADRIRFAFHLYDRDNDGKISKKELQSVIELSAKLSGTDKQPIKVDLLMKQFDKDQDNKINLQEFERMVSEKPELRNTVLDNLIAAPATARSKLLRKMSTCTEK